jgi:hypothetical protein
VANNFIADLEQRFEGWPGSVLTLMLLVGSAVIAAIALFSKSNVVKAIVLAYIVLP